MLTETWQKLQGLTKHQLGDETLDQRARILLSLCGHDAEKRRGQQCSGFVGTVCQKWATETHRRTGAEQAGKRLGAQGPAPQKAAKRQAGANRQVLAAEPSGDMAQR